MRTLFLVLMVVVLVFVGIETFFHKEAPFPANTTSSADSVRFSQTVVH